MASQSWKDYVNYLDNVVLEEFDSFVRKSLNYLMDNMVMDVSYRRPHGLSHAAHRRNAMCRVTATSHCTLDPPPAPVLQRFWSP